MPDEPPEDALGAISQLRFKCPGGEVITRRFWAENTLQDVLNFLTAEGFHTEDYKVITTFPRRDVSFSVLFVLMTYFLHSALTFHYHTNQMSSKQKKQSVVIYSIQARSKGHHHQWGI